ncbi:hypothetical protein PLICRDRAFT_40321 [Plicaturopsis crispa FD-325 SS-3]|nr:hypothetical protein PLICRDRAFT_40321 [Plicaturopsis crispa FD-325 SS-3]
MASSALSKKRKRDSTDDAGKVSFQLSNEPETRLGPVLVSYPALQPPKKTPFKCYIRPQQREAATEDEVLSAQTTFVAGEADTVEFVSSSETQSASAGCRYMVAVHNKRTNTTVLRPAPLHILSRQVKALKGIEPAPVSALERLQARSMLGETFGTKKAKANIRAAERNKVDVSAMEAVAGTIQASIEKNTVALPSKEEAKAIGDNARLIPAHNATADDPADVYPLHNIIPEVEWKALSISTFTSAPTDKDRLALLPFSRSKWVAHHLERIFAVTPISKQHIKILFYISSMLAFRSATFRMAERKDPIHERLARVPSLVVDGLLARFTETSRGSTDALTTPQTETNLLTHIFALMLRLDGYATDPTIVADDLSMTPTKINQLFKSLGCKIEKLKMTDLKRLGLPESAAATKRAILKAPPEFPKPKVLNRR